MLISASDGGGGGGAAMRALATYTATSRADHKTDSLPLLRATTDDVLAGISLPPTLTLLCTSLLLVFYPSLK